jgi:hypothetical protein
MQQGDASTSGAGIGGAAAAAAAGTHQTWQQHWQQVQSLSQQQQVQQPHPQPQQQRRGGGSGGPEGPPPLLNDRWRTSKFVFAGGLAGAISRTATAPIDRLKMLLQVQESRHLSLRQGLKIMASEGERGGGKSWGRRLSVCSITVSVLPLAAAADC